MIYHFDNLKISHVESTVVSNTIRKLEEVFGQEAPLTITRGKYHEYLGMYLDFSKKGKVTVDLKKFVTEFISQVPADMSEFNNTPASLHLLQVNNQNSTLMNKDTAYLFHTLLL
jgi:hypothetical protein